MAKHTTKFGFGDKVSLSYAPIDGVVTAVFIRGTSATYEVGYMADKPDNG